MTETSVAQTVIDTLVTQIDSDMASYLEACVHCGECAEACPKEISIDSIAIMNADYRKAKTINRKSLSRA